MSTAPVNRIYIYKQLHATDTAVAPICTELRSASAIAGALTWKRRARDEHSARESYLITVVVLPFKNIFLVVLTSPESVRWSVLVTTSRLTSQSL